MNFKLITISVTVSLIFSGCAGTMKRPTPPNGKVPVYATKYSPSSMNMPMGTTTIDDSSLAIKQSGANDGLAVASAIVGFGLIGVLATQAVMQSQTKSSITYVDVLKNVSMRQHTNSALTQLKKQKKLIPILQPVDQVVKGERYELRPFLYFEANEKNQHELLTILRVAQFDNSNKQKWLGQYVNHINIEDTKLLTNEKYINSKINSAILESTKIFNSDMKGQLKKDEDKVMTIKVKDSVMFSEGIFSGWILPSKNKKITLFQTGFSPDMIHGGIHIFDSSRIEEIKAL